MKCKLLYSDTDSFLYEIETKDLYQDLAYNSVLTKHFDFLNYEERHSLFSNAQKKEALKFKDEMAGKIVKEFVCLKPKLHSILTEGELILVINNTLMFRTKQFKITFNQKIVSFFLNKLITLIWLVIDSNAPNPAFQIIY